MLSCFSKKKQAPNAANNAKFKKPYYSIKSIASGKVLDMSQANEQLVIWDHHGGDTQMFTIKQKGPDFYIKCKKSKLYLTVDGPQNGARVYGTSKNMGENQRFRIEQVEAGSKKYAIYTHFGKVLDVAQAKESNGTMITQYDFIGKQNQLWLLCEPSEVTSSSSSQDNNKK